MKSKWVYPPYLKNVQHYKSDVEMYTADEVREFARNTKQLVKEAEGDRGLQLWHYEQMIKEILD